MEPNTNQNAPDTDPVAVPENELKMPTQTPVSGPEKHSHLGIMIGILILVLLLILGGLYLWKTTLDKQMEEDMAAMEDETMMDEAEIDEGNMETTSDPNDLAPVSESDEIDAIEADVEATNIENIDAEMAEIEAEMEAAMQEN